MKTKNKLSDLPNIGITLEKKLNQINIKSVAELFSLGTEKTTIKLLSLQDNGVCINMIYALEGAIQGIRWHGLNKERKYELNEFYKSLQL